MPEEDEVEDVFSIEGDPGTEFYISTQGNICINQISEEDDSDETIYFTLEEAELAVKYLEKCIALRRSGYIPPDDGEDDLDEGEDMGEEFDLEGSDFDNDGEDEDADEEFDEDEDEEDDEEEVDEEDGEK